MTINITIETENAAFEDISERPEVARILRELADKIETYRNPSVIMDINGNRCGSFEVVEA